MSRINAITENIFNIFRAIKDILIEVVQIPFRIWFSLPREVHMTAAGMIIIATLLLMVLFWKKRNEWRHRYIT